MNLKIWQLHPQACRVEQAEKNCMGTANEAGVKWCGPYVNANQAGFWVYSPISFEFVYDGNEFHVSDMEEYTPEDYDLVKSLVRPEDNSCFDKWTFPGAGRTKTTFSLIENNVIQIWTGLIFQTPPGWCLQIRSPINFPYSGFNVVEAILETDWMQYDIWMNISVTQANTKILIDKSQPIAHLLPVRRESFKGEWTIERNEINRDSKEANDVFSYWLQYNKQKFEFGGKQALSETLTKDSTTYFRERQRLLGKEMEPIPGVEKCPEKKISKCPYSHLHQDSLEVPIYEPVPNVMFERFFKKT